MNVPHFAAAMGAVFLSAVTAGAVSPSPAEEELAGGKGLSGIGELDFYTCSGAVVSNRGHELFFFE
jgi:hypothetical protein